MSKQNILIIMADQLTALALGCYGNPTVKSPNIDRLAAEGVKFEAAYSSSPLCTPARYAFMTGQNISQCGGYDNAAYMPSTMPTFAHYMRMMGYRTCLSGKMHFVGSDQLHGFEERVTTDVYPADFGWMPDWNNAEERIDLWYHNMSSVKQAGVASITNQLAYDDEVGATTMRAIYDHARSEDERPLCMVASFIHPHDPYAARQKYWDLYEDVDIPLPTVPRPAQADNDPHNLRLEKAIALDAVDVSDEEIINARRAYYANVSFVDEWVGRLRTTLEECGMAENTTIIFTADHGDMLGEFGLWYKMTFREWSCRIPMIVHNPHQFAARSVSQPVAQVDVTPTLMDLAQRFTGTEQPEAIDPLNGRSLLPLCDGDDAEDPNACVSEYLAEGASAPMLMIRRGQYKFISCMVDPDQLFDLEADPNELVNLANDSATERQQALLAGFREEAFKYWDPEQLRQKVISDQTRRRVLSGALRIGKYTSWDFNPVSDASEQYTRSHMDLTRHDIASRFPRPPKFKPKWT
ncbi:MAG: choline-sulfatase [Leucothrix sp.]